jgi:hypothetical protein
MKKFNPTFTNRHYNCTAHYFIKDKNCIVKVRLSKKNIIQKIINLFRKEL